MDNDEVKPTGSLYRFDARGLHRCDDDYVITNGPTTSPDGRTLYHVDTLERVIYAFDLARTARSRHVASSLASTTPTRYPDGPAVDAEGCVWIGLFGGWGVQRYSPQGELLTNCRCRSRTAPSRCSAATTSHHVHHYRMEGLVDEQRAQQPLAGGLFAVRVDTPGLPHTRLRNDRQDGV